MNGAVVAALLVCGSLWAPVTGFLMQKISACGYGDDRHGNVTFASLFTLNRQFVLMYSEPDMMYLPCPLGCVDEMRIVAGEFASLLNTDPGTTTRVNEQKTHCKEQASTFWNKTVDRRVAPSVEVFSPPPVHAESLPVLVCYVWGFYPQDISVAWFKNDRLVKNFTGAESAGDWTYRLVAVLDLRGTRTEDNYTCVVDHPSLDLPIVKKWKHGFTNIQVMKISVASVVFALGLVSLITGVECWRNAKRRGYSPIPGVNVD